MNLFCLQNFKSEFDKLKSKKPYRTIEKDIIDYFFEKEIDQLFSGTRLNGCSDSPYIKKRLNGSGGFRIYFLLIVRKENVYLMFVHPKTGPDGSDNITDESKAFLYKEVYRCIQSNDLYKLTLDDSKEKIVFEKISTGSL